MSEKKPISQKPLMNPRVLESFRELESDGSPDFLQEYLTAFLEPLSGRLAKIQKAIARKDFRELKEHAHALNSSFSTAGVSKMSSLCAELEAMAMTSLLEGAEEKAALLIQLHDQLKSEIYGLPEMKRVFPKVKSA